LTTLTASPSYEEFGDCFENEDYQSVEVHTRRTNLSKRMAAKIDTQQGRKIYPQRFAVAEPVFANIRTHKRLDRFILRGKAKVNIQWLLYCMIHDIEKIINYGFASMKRSR
jgi:hypothetical protein